MIDKFEKVPFEEFERAATICGADAPYLAELYENIKLPMRATRGSAGYDFYTPFDIRIYAGESVIIPTGIRAVIPENWTLLCVPRSGNGFKTGVRLMNTVGVIDSDYYNPGKCEGQIMIKLTNKDYGDRSIEYKRGDGIMQGILVPYCTLDEYDEERWAAEELKERTGGFGSTGA
ncbi:MAG: dUTP diphosphatase [Oscillospiraceae bacterium]|nr:dUTP diphosphatase [Oscillospiraceae bacterium]